MRGPSSPPPPPPRPPPPIPPGPCAAKPWALLAGGTPPPIGTPSGPPRSATPPRLIDLVTRKSTVQFDAPRKLLRPTPAGRSLNTVSSLLSMPVVRLYGRADEYCELSPTRSP